ncbi:TetR/AcrR family transcriptional regulator [Actinotalea sp. M2MS4P-6]|uniref:TetR/AcrR family transcriptional regulator n=1 Tax=Actinotalea sp. M2MS4P-6 TaxID=2983762 RepID=UPI0021E37C7C|nr:TetR/AcrR family transcriptional regulator [Actinotalea sp. M2MS4P-6]MCV2396391.1 TetR/AcrR family transcriptional regulator [Actinotalea sp. M2MS4P-6]
MTDEHRAARRAQVLDAARRCFAAEGFHQTSMDDVIRASGLSAGAVYQYYRSKDELIVAAAAEALSSIRDRLDRLDLATGTSPAAAVVDVLRTLPFASSPGGVDITRIALNGWTEALRNDELHSLVHEGYGTFRAQIATLLRSWRDEGRVRPDLDPEAVAPILLSLVLGHVVQQALFGDEADPGIYERGIADLLGD